MDKSEALAIVALKKSGAVDVSAAIAAKTAAQAAAAQAVSSAETAAAAAEELGETVEDVAELKTDVSALKSHFNLNAEEIPDTVQSITFDAAGNVDTITHTRDNVAIRTDAFTFGSNTITEVRTLNTGESLTIATNTDTLVTTVTYSAA